MNDTALLNGCPELVAMLKRGTASGRTKQFPNLGSTSTLNNLIVLRNLFTEIKPKRTMEVGLALGGSGLLFTESHRESKASPERQHVAIDPFQTEFWDRAGQLAIEGAGLGGYFELIEEFSSLALPALVKQQATFDLIYVDGCHLYEDVFVDTYFSVRLLSQGGLVVLDDSSDPHVAKAIRFFTSNFASILEPFDLSPFRADKGKPLRYRVARLLGKTQMTAFRKIGPSQRSWDAPFTNF